MARTHQPARDGAGPGGDADPVAVAASGELINFARSHGNQRLARMRSVAPPLPVLARQPAAATASPGTFAPEDLVVSEFDVTPSGNTEAIPQGADAVKFQAPLHKFSAKAAPAPDKLKDQKVNVGFVQVMTKSERSAIYTKDGTPGGEVVGEMRTDTPDNRRDSLPEPGGTTVDPYYGTEGTKQKPVAGRWYKPPGVTGGGFGPVELNTMDRPSWGATTEAYKGKGKLSGAKGHESFRLSVGAAIGGEEPKHLAAKEWGFSWDVTVAAGKGKEGDKVSDVAKAKLASLDSGQGLTFDDAEVWDEVRSKEIALTLTNRQLLVGVTRAKGRSADGWRYMCEALRERNPGFTISLKDVSTNVLPTTSHVFVSLEGGRGPRERELTGNASSTWGLLDFWDPQDITTSSSIKVTIDPKGKRGGPKSTDFVFPFLGGGKSFVWDEYWPDLKIDMSASFAG